MYGKLFVLMAVLAAASQAKVYNTFLCKFLLQDVTASLASTGCIALQLCLNQCNDEVGKGFANCYDESPLGKQQFLDCQREHFDGRIIDSAANAAWVCSHVWKLGGYAKCLGPAFTAAKINQTQAVEGVNECQGKLLGLGA